MRVYAVFCGLGTWRWLPGWPVVGSMLDARYSIDVLVEHGLTDFTQDGAGLPRLEATPHPRSLSPVEAEREGKSRSISRPPGHRRGFSCQASQANSESLREQVSAGLFAFLKRPRKGVWDAWRGGFGPMFIGLGTLVRLAESSVGLLTNRLASSRRPGRRLHVRGRRVGRAVWWVGVRAFEGGVRQKTYRTLPYPTVPGLAGPVGADFC